MEKESEALKVAVSFILCQNNLELADVAVATIGANMQGQLVRNMSCKVAVMTTILIYPFGGLILVGVTFVYWVTTLWIG